MWQLLGGHEANEAGLAVTQGVKKALLEEVAAREVALASAGGVARLFCLPDEPRTPLRRLKAKDVDLTPEKLAAPTSLEERQRRRRKEGRCTFQPATLRELSAHQAKVHMYRMDVNDEEACTSSGTTWDDVHFFAERGASSMHASCLVRDGTGWDDQGRIGCVGELEPVTCGLLVDDLASDAYSDAQSFTVDEAAVFCAAKGKCSSRCQFPDIVEEYEGLWEQLGSGVEALMALEFTQRSCGDEFAMLFVECSECLWNPFALVMCLGCLGLHGVPEILRWRTTSRETRHPKALLAHVAEMGSLERSTATVSLHTALKNQEAFDADHAGQQKLFDCGRWCMALASATLTHLPASDTRRIVEDNLRSLFRQCRDPDDIAHSPALRTLLVYGECALPYVQQLIANTMLGFIEASLSTSPLNYDAVLDFMVHLQVVLRSMTKCQRQKWVSLTVRFLAALAALDLDLSSICSVVVYDLIWLWRVDEDPRRTYASVMPKLREFLQSPSFHEFVPDLKRLLLLY
ncbi:unnamed protein product [Symbiodinium natans]|uniref:Uncharacterized protein n=1 Tax=Symbiodinium natans TaxID=878477 RepID=A0A812SZS2_9DINO|nr:unnamed protein product [Symbiodinium natans]